MSYWRGFNYKPSRRLPAAGIKAQIKGGVGDTWWSERWLGVLRSFHMGARLDRGRSYARSGQVLKVGIEPGAVKALVQGSVRQPYIVVIRLKPLSDRQWERATKAMAAKAVFAAKLLAGEMPRDIEQAFAGTKCTLFPKKPKDLVTECDCPDWANPCKHVAAVYYVLGEMFDRDPFVLFALRGRDRARIIKTLRELRTAAAVTGGRPETAGEPAAAAPAPLEGLIDSFWKPGRPWEHSAFDMRRPAAPAAMVKMLGPAPFSLGGRNLSDILAGWYDEVSKAAERRAME